MILSYIIGALIIFPIILFIVGKGLHFQIGNKSWLKGGLLFLIPAVILLIFFYFVPFQYLNEYAEGFKVFRTLGEVQCRELYTPCEFAPFTPSEAILYTSLVIGICLVPFFVIGTILGHFFLKYPWFQVLFVAGIIAEMLFYTKIAIFIILIPTVFALYLWRTKQNIYLWIKEAAKGYGISSAFMIAGIVPLFSIICRSGSACTESYAAVFIGYIYVGITILVVTAATITGIVIGVRKNKELKQIRN